MSMCLKSKVQNFMTREFHSNSILRIWLKEKLEKQQCSILRRFFFFFLLKTFKRSKCSRVRLMMFPVDLTPLPLMQHVEGGGEIQEIYRVISDENVLEHEDVEQEEQTPQEEHAEPLIERSTRVHQQSEKYPFSEFVFLTDARMQERQKVIRKHKLIKIDEWKKAMQSE